MVDHRPLLLAHLQWLSGRDLSILEHLKVYQSILIDDSWRLELLTIELGHVRVNLNSPFIESFVILEHSDHLADSVESLLSSDKLVLLDFPHFSLVFGEVYWERGLVAALSWKVDSLVPAISPLVNEQKWLLMVKLDVVNFLEVFLHVGLAKTFLIRFLGLVIE